MKKIVPFTKDIPFKTNISEISSISLENTLKLTEENSISGDFIVEGSYKLLKGSPNTTEFSYHVPVDVTIDERYESKEAKISVTDFYYEVINEDTLRVNIELTIDSLEYKETKLKEEKINIPYEEEFEVIEPRETRGESSRADTTNRAIEKEKELFNIDSTDKSYSFYYVYTMTEVDTIPSIMEKYNTTRDDLACYNDLDNIKSGSKVIIPSTNENK